MRRTLRRLLPLLKNELDGGKDCKDNRSRLARDEDPLLGRNDVLADGIGVDQDRGGKGGEGQADRCGDDPVLGARERRLDAREGRTLSCLRRTLSCLRRTLSCLRRLDAREGRLDGDQGLTLICDPRVGGGGFGDSPRTLGDGTRGNSAGNSDGVNDAVGREGGGHHEEHGAAHADCPKMSQVQR